MLNVFLINYFHFIQPKIIQNGSRGPTPIKIPKNPKMSKILESLKSPKMRLKFNKFRIFYVKVLRCVT